MQAYRIAEKAGSVRAPSGFVAALRRGTGDSGLEVWWDPDVAVYNQHPRNNGSYEPSPYGSLRGCWVVWKRIKVAEVGALGIVHMVNKLVDVYRLDGMYGKPMTLGSWVVSVLNESDVMKNTRRFRDLDDINEGQVLKEEADAEDVAKGIAHDRFFQRVIARAQEQIGVPSTIREERVATEKALVKRDEAIKRMTRRKAKDYRFRGTR
jgi:hypothetical protein